MKRFLIVANSPFTVVNFRKELILELLALGHEVHVICPSSCNLVEDSNYLSYLKSKGVLFHNIVLGRSSLNPFSELLLFLSIYRLISAISPDAVLNYTIKPTIYASIAAGWLGIEHVYSNITGLGFIFTGTTFKAKILSVLVRFQYKIALKYNKKIFFQNTDDLSIFEKYKLLQRSKTVLINGSGVNTVKFSSSKEYVEGPIKFLFVGRLLRDKGIFEFIEAAKSISEMYPKEAVFYIAGPYDSNPASIKSSDMDEYIKSGLINYLGNVSDILEAYEESDVFVLPSYREGTPRSTLEAMSMSMPIITTDAPGCRETVVDGLNGFLVEKGNYFALGNAMIKFIENRELITSMGVESRTLAVAKYDVNKVNGVILDVIGQF
ncbi:glycosyltransferase family 4 protein [Pseudoalteromonas sp. 31A1]|uniref:glycosyltransferase family 4 protein n=1 Tax=Pseudoalteromonas sp. 31A1 TaxID=2686351 RepID=UPI0013FDE58E|nr:glycosyltransferase family 4 protein [Pseudoalteromonas sp. 31A1]